MLIPVILLHKKSQKECSLSLTDVDKTVDAVITKISMLSFEGDSGRSSHGSLVGNHPSGGVKQDVAAFIVSWVCFYQIKLNPTFEKMRSKKVRH